MNIHFKNDNVLNNLSNILEISNEIRGDDYSIKFDKKILEIYDEDNVSKFIYLIEQDNISLDGNDGSKHSYYAVCKYCGVKMWSKAVKSRYKRAHFYSNSHTEQCKSERKCQELKRKRNLLEYEKAEVNKEFIIDVLQNNKNIVAPIFRVIGHEKHNLTVHKTCKFENVSEHFQQIDIKTKEFKCVLVMEFDLNEISIKDIKDTLISIYDGFYFYSNDDTKSRIAFRIFFNNDSIKSFEEKLKLKKNIRVTFGTCKFKNFGTKSIFTNENNPVTLEQIYYHE